MSNYEEKPDRTSKRKSILNKIRNSVDILYNTSGRGDKIIREPEDRSKVIAKNTVQGRYLLDHITVWDICKVDTGAKVYLIRCQRKIKRKLGRKQY